MQLCLLQTAAVQQHRIGWTCDMFVGWHYQNFLTLLVALQTQGNHALMVPQRGYPWFGWKAHFSDQSKVSCGLHGRALLHVQKCHPLKWIDCNHKRLLQSVSFAVDQTKSNLPMPVCSSTTNSPTTMQNHWRVPNLTSCLRLLCMIEFTSKDHIVILLDNFLWFWGILAAFYIAFCGYYTFTTLHYQSQNVRDHAHWCKYQSCVADSLSLAFRKYICHSPSCSVPELWHGLGALAVWVLRPITRLMLRFSNILAHQVPGLICF